MPSDEGKEACYFAHRVALCKNMVQLSDLPAVDTVTLVIITEWGGKSLLNISGNACSLFLLTATGATLPEHKMNFRWKKSVTLGRPKIIKKYKFEFKNMVLIWFFFFLNYITPLLAAEEPITRTASSSAKDQSARKCWQSVRETLSTDQLWPKSQFWVPTSSSALSDHGHLLSVKEVPRLTNCQQLSPTLRSVSRALSGDTTAKSLCYTCIIS